MTYKINAMYFSPTNTTKYVVSSIAKRISSKMNMENDINYIDFTEPGVRKEKVSFIKDEIVIIGIPVYAGRVPNVLLKYLNSISSSGALAVPVVLYGNRNYDDALIELSGILELNGFNIIAAAAFIGEHSFSYILAKGRPDDKDTFIINEFSDEIHSLIKEGLIDKKVEVSGESPLRPYYMPRDNNGNPIDIRKVTPKTNDNCSNCKLCAKVCPMGSIDINDVCNLIGICIKCGACIKSCPEQAKYFDDLGYLLHKEELEIKHATRREPELFLPIKDKNN